MVDTVEAMVDGGKATAGPPLGPALGPKGVNIGQVIAKINEKTKAFAGMKVPVKVLINSDKTFDIKVGTPPMSALIKGELGVSSGAHNARTEKVGNLTLDQAKKIADISRTTSSEPISRQGSSRSRAIAFPSESPSTERTPRTSPPPSKPASMTTSSERNRGSGPLFQFLTISAASFPCARIESLFMGSLGSFKYNPCLRPTACRRAQKLVCTTRRNCIGRKTNRNGCAESTGQCEEAQFY